MCQIAVRNKGQVAGQRHQAQSRHRSHGEGCKGEACCQIANKPRIYNELDAAYDEDRMFPSFIGLGSKVISCGSISHCLGAPGLRVGWIISRDRAVRGPLVTRKFNTMIASSVVDEFLALKVFQRRDSVLRERRQRLRQGPAILTDLMLEHGDLLEWIRPDAGASCCARLRCSRFDDAAVGRFYEESAIEGVKVAKGTWFGEEACVVRLGFGSLPASKFMDSLAALSAALKRAR